MNFHSLTPPLSHALTHMAQLVCTAHEAPTCLALALIPLAHLSAYACALPVTAHYTTTLYDTSRRKPRVSKETWAGQVNAA
jgi:hypothetical protein